MTDLIERLRGFIVWNLTPDICNEAADEIERLRHEIAVMTYGIEVENAELREELAACQKDAERERTNFRTVTDRLQSQLDSYTNKGLQLIGRAVLEELEADAERYRWLRGNAHSMDVVQWMMGDHGWQINIMGDYATVDAAIDAAMQKEVE